MIIDLSLRNPVPQKSNEQIQREQNPKTKFHTKSYQQRFRSARGVRERLQALIFAKFPNVLDL
jgi:hypothetical protein